jgi:hypothetical protein
MRSDPSVSKDQTYSKAISMIVIMSASGLRTAG